MDTTNFPADDQLTPPLSGGQPVAQPQGTPVSGGHKEHAPIGARTEYVSHAPVESAPQIPKELQELGIEESPDTEKPDIAPDVQQAGVQPVKTAAPVATTSPSQVVLPTPMTYEQAVTNMKQHKTDESISWLSMLSKYVLEKMGMQEPK